MKAYQDRDKKKRVPGAGCDPLYGPVPPIRAITIELYPPTGQATILRGQLTLLRKRCEIGIAVDTASIARAENLARELEGAI